jgi:signal transduction histidine kinase
VNIANKDNIYKGNKEKFEKAMSQYLSNSLIRINSNGKINLSINQEKDKLTISIEDDGMSVTANSTTLSDMGTIMANAIIDLMGGLTIKNFADKNSISTTKITLPISGEHIKLRPLK